MTPLRALVLFALAVCPAAAQVIDFESGGLHYKTLTKNGVTIMFAHLPTHIRDYAIMQVAVSNGSQIPWTIKPTDFRFERTDGPALNGALAGTGALLAVFALLTSIGLVI